MSRVKLLIVEDELIVAEDMRDMLEELGYEVTGVADTPEEAKRMLIATSPDLALLDITLGTRQSGIDLGEYIASELNIPFIFCTSHADSSTVTKATQVRPHGYLVKPFVKEDLYTSIELALANFSSSKTAPTSPSEQADKSNDLVIKDSLFIKEGLSYVKVKVSAITWLSPDGNYTTIHVQGGKKYLVRVPLKDLHEQLGTHTYFRIHRSYVVNLEYVEAIKNQSVIVEGEELPLGRQFRDDLLAQIHRMQ